MKKKDYEEIEDLDDEIIDDDEVLDDVDEEDEFIEDEPKKPAKKTAKPVKKAPAKKKMKKGAKVAIISSSVAVGVIAIALVTIFAILPALGISLLGGTNKNAPQLFYKEDSVYGLYFYGDNHKVLNTGAKDSDIDMVRASKDLDKSYFDPDKPTIIWTHGWEMTGSFGDAYLCAGADTRKAMKNYDINYAEELKKQGYNVATFQYQGYGTKTSFAADLSSIYKYTVYNIDKTGYSMSYMFASELATILGEKYQKDITLVGHSCGGFVSTATAYMLQYFYQEGTFKNKHLVPTRLILEDPYVDGVENKKFTDTQKMCGTKEDIKERTKCEVVLDMIASLGKNSNVAIDVYLGMAGASTTFIEGGDHFTEALKYCTVMDMTGMKQWQGSPVGNIHVLTRDWVWASMLGDKLTDNKGNPAPTAARTNEEIIALRGNLYQQTAKGFCWAGGTGVTEVIKNVDNTDGFYF